MPDREFAEEMKWYASLSLPERQAYDDVKNFGFPLDYLNNWETFTFLNVDILQPIPTFAQYVEGKGEIWSQDVKDFVLNHSRVKIGLFDALAQKFNSKLAERGLDIPALQEFYRQAKSIESQK